MATVSYGKITLVDLTDLGTFSVYPMSNLPISVVNDPNTNSYVPNWQDSPLTITPVAYYAGQSVTPSTVTWKVQINSGSKVTIDESKGEAKNVSNALVVNKNRFAETDVKIITYYCESTYIEPESGTTLTAEGQISYSLVQQASEVKACNITGANVFKYNTNSSLIGSEYIVLTGNISNVTISKWQYKNSSGVWTDYPITSGKNTSNTSNTLNVYATENVFVNDIATIKLLTNDNSVFDIFTIAKLRDGAAGEGTVTSILSNENQMIPCDSNGNPTSFDGASTTIYIYDGGEDSTSTWTIKDPTLSANASLQVGCTGTWNSSTHTYTVTGMTSDAATVTFECSKSGYANIIKTFNLIKMKVGADGTSPTIYTIEPSALALNRNSNSVYSPSTVTFKAYSQTGSAQRSAYNGVFKIYLDGSSTASYTSASSESTKVYTPSGNTLKTIKCELYTAGGSGNPVDVQTVIITDDGVKGDDSYTVLLGNENHTFSANRTNAYASSITSTVDAYKGTTKIATTVGTISGCPDGMTITPNNNGTTSTTLAISVTTALTTKTGTVTIPITTADGKTFNKLFSYSLAFKGEDGASGSNAILFEIIPEGNDTIINDSNNVILAPRIMDGGTTGTLSASSCSWSKYNSSLTGNDPYELVDASQVSNNKLTVIPAMVDGYAMFRCVATYASKTYTAFYAVHDKTDPIQVYVFSTVGEKILNGNGVGVIYAIAERNGSPIDEIPEIVNQLTDATGTSCYVINKTNNRVDYYSRSSTSVSWGSPSSRTTNATYTWTFRDKNGNRMAYNSSNTVSGQAFFISGDYIDKKIVIDVEVSV